jgi:hypothetical protein
MSSEGYGTRCELWRSRAVEFRGCARRIDDERVRDASRAEAHAAGRRRENRAMGCPLGGNWETCAGTPIACSRQIELPENGRRPDGPAHRSGSSAQRRAPSLAARPVAAARARGGPERAALASPAAPPGPPAGTTTPLRSPPARFPPTASAALLAFRACQSRSRSRHLRPSTRSRPPSSRTRCFASLLSAPALVCAPPVGAGYALPGRGPRPPRAGRRTAAGGQANLRRVAALDLARPGSAGW